MQPRYKKNRQARPASVSWKSRKFGLIVLVAFCLTLILQGQYFSATAYQPNLTPENTIVQQPIPSSDLLQQGKTYYQNGQLADAIRVWEEARKTYAAEGKILSQIQVLNYLALAYKDVGKLDQAQTAIAESIEQSQHLDKRDTQTQLLLAQALNTQGTIQFLQGQTQIALETWKNAAKTYEDAGDLTGKLLAQINQAQAFQASGEYRRAKSMLEQLVTELNQQPDTLLKAQGLRSLGVALQTIGDLLQSKAVLEQSWQISQQFNSPTDVSATLFSIGNVARDLKDYAAAWSYYQEAEKLSSDPLSQLEAQLNQLGVLVELQKWEPAIALIPIIEPNLAQLPPSRPAIYAKINLAESLLRLDQNRPNQQSQLIAQLLGTAVQQARQIQDSRAEAYSLYELGKVYQEKGQYTDAKDLTKQSLKLSQEINANDISARAAGQLAVLLKQEGNTSEAINAYQIAFNNIQSLRNDLVAINSDIQFDFKEGIEPVYRDFVSLLLQKGDDQASLKQAREVMEALQLAELDNFFQDACLDSHPVSIDEIDKQAAVVYPVILRDRLDVILSIPNQPLQHYTTSLSQKQVEGILEHFYSSFSPGYPRDEHLQLSQQVYNWLIAPARSALEASNIKTLVFVPDGFLRNLPMAALYDGTQYLIQNYNVVLSPGLQLFPQGLPQQKLNVLAAGLTESRQGFNSLPGVAEEVKEVTSEITSKVLLNQEFTSDQFKKVIDSESFPIIHLATHGQFSSNPDQTFLLTWSDRISIEDFDLLFQKRRLGILKPIELLVMSACQTAVGDKRATLGLAGFALRSGAKSTLASLWSVSDESTSSLMREFYRQITTEKVSKAEALRQAQLKVMNNPLYKHPYFWSSFVLVGNWL